MSYFANTKFEEPALTAACFNQKQPDVRCSPRYRQVDTGEIVTYLREKDFKVSHIKASRAGTKAGEYGKHLVYLRQEFGQRTAGDCFPELILSNSHNATSRCSLTLGLRRVACDNGLISGTLGEFSYSLTHVGDIKEQALKIADSIMERVPQLSEIVRKWDARNLTPAEQKHFAQQAVKLRFGGAFGAEIPSLLTVRRTEDVGDSLWQIFNRAQESLTKGGVRAVYTKEARRTRRLIRPLSAPSRVLQFNRALWDLAEEVYEN